MNKRQRKKAGQVGRPIIWTLPKDDLARAFREACERGESWTVWPSPSPVISERIEQVSLR